MRDGNVFSIEMCYKTQKGKNRDINEDSLLATRYGDVYILAVADGLGGHSAGEVASKSATGELAQSLKLNLPGNGVQEAISMAIMSINASLHRLSTENRDYRGMATTLVAAVVSANESLIANVGDSRAYLAGPGIRRITRDHSLVQQMVDKCLISKKEAYSHRQKNIITMSLGRRMDIYPDFYPVALSGKTLLLCSDGLTDALRDEEIGSVITGSLTLKEACDSLIKAAIERHATDDITVLLAREAGQLPDPVSN